MKKFLWAALRGGFYGFLSFWFIYTALSIFGMKWFEWDNAYWGLVAAFTVNGIQWRIVMYVVLREWRK